MNSPSLRLGSHLSIAKGLPKSAAMAQEIGANTFQFFTRNPRGGSARQIPASEIEKWEQVRAEHDLYPIVGHLPYTVNLAAPKAETQDFAKMVLAQDLARMNTIGAEFLVVHPGSHAGEGMEKGRQRILDTLSAAFLPFTGDAQLLLETMAGQGSEIGSLTDLAFFIRELGSPPNLGICIDTCHLFAAGYELRTEDGLERLVDEIESSVGLERVKVVHLNDSKSDLGSHRDRHELLGQGYIGRQGIINVLTHSAFSQLPLLLETPVANYRHYGAEIRLLRSWLQ
ncbi:MAG: deoxyribonuclease IV [bacterium]